MAQGSGSGGVGPAIARLAAVAVLAAMALPALMAGEFLQASFIGSFAFATFFGVLAHGLTRPLGGVEAFLLSTMAMCGLITLLILLMLQVPDPAARCARYDMASAGYVGGLAAAVVVLSQRMQKRAKGVLDATAPDARAPLGVFVVGGVGFLLVAFGAVALLSVHNLSCGGARPGRDVVILFGYAFSVLMAAAYVNTALIQKRARG